MEEPVVVGPSEARSIEMSPSRAERTLRGKVAVVGIGETTYYKHGQAPDSEFTLALRAIMAACDDAGISPLDIDGFASYSNDRNEPSRLAAALGLPELRFSNMQWGGGGGGGSAAVGNAAAAILAGMSDCVVVFRALPGAVPALRHRLGRQDGVRRASAHVPVRPLLTGAALRHAGDALSSREWARPVGPAGDRAGLVSSRAAEPAGRDARPAADAGSLRCVALD